MFIFNLLPQILIVLILVLVLKWRFNRRKLYKLAKMIKGPIHLPFFGSMIRIPMNNEDILKMLCSLFNKYGTLFKIWTGPYLIVGCSKPEDMEIILNSPKCIDKPKTFFRPVRSVFHKGLVSAPGSLWKVNRKILTKSFNKKLFPGYIEVMSKNAKKLATTIKTEVRSTKCSTVDCYKITLQYTLYTIFETMLNVNSESPLSKECTQLVQELVAWMGARFFRYWYFIEPIFTIKGIKKEIQDLDAKSLELVNKILAEKDLQGLNLHTAAGNDSELHNTAMLDSLIYDHKFTTKQLRDEIVTFAIGGGDTSATVICYTLLCLGIHPEIQERMHEELMEVIGSGDVLAKHLPELKYINRVIQESLRIFPVFQNIARNVSEDLLITDGIILPAGTTVIISITNAHMNKDYWPDPWRFDPDRFLPENVSNRPSYVYLPFSKGPRNCIAKKLGDLIVLIYLATLLKHFRVETDYKSLQDVKQSSTIFNTPVHGFKLRLIERRSDNLADI